MPLLLLCYVADEAVKPSGNVDTNSWFCRSFLTVLIFEAVKPFGNVDTNSWFCRSFLTVLIFDTNGY